jgi:hypothetical protein
MEQLPIVKNPSYFEMKEQVKELARRMNVITQNGQFVTNDSNEDRTISFAEESWVISMPDDSQLREDLEACEAENESLREENESLQGIINGSCWTRECVETRNSGVCGNSVSTATALMCYTGVNGSNLHTFELTSVRVQEGGDGYSCGQKISMRVGVDGWSGGGDDSQTIIVPANRDNALFDITYSWSAFGGPTINNEKIGQIFLPDNGGTPTFYPPFQDSNT